MKKLLTAVVVFIIFSASTVHAEIKTYTGVGEYLLTEETLEFGKNQAEISAARDILDKICVYVKGRSLMIDNELNDDEVITISAGILHVTDTKFVISDDAEGILVKAFVTAEIDTNELESLLDKEIKARNQEN